MALTVVAIAASCSHSGRATKNRLTAVPARAAQWVPAKDVGRAPCTAASFAWSDTTATCYRLPGSALLTPSDVRTKDLRRDPNDPATWRVDFTFAPLAAKRLNQWIATHPHVELALVDHSTVLQASTVFAPAPTASFGISNLSHTQGQRIVDALGGSDITSRLVPVPRSAATG